MFLLSRILMNAADGGSGNGAVIPPASAAPAAPPAAPAQGDAPITRKDFEAFTSTFGQTLAKTVNDGVFANLRRAGVLKDQPTSTPPKTTTTDEVQTPSSTPAANPLKLRAFDRALARNGHNLSEANYARYERMFVAEDPQDADAWIKEVLPSTGTAPPAAAAAAATTQNTTATPSGPTASDRGAPPPAKTPPDEINLVTASKADRDAFIKAKGLKAYTTKLRSQMVGVRVKL